MRITRGYFARLASWIQLQSGAAWHCFSGRCRELACCVPACDGVDL